MVATNAVAADHRSCTRLVHKDVVVTLTAILLLLAANAVGTSAAQGNNNNDGGSAGKSGGSQMPDIVEALTEVESAQHFDELIESSAVGSVVAFTVSWCGHCKELKPELEAAAVELATIGIPVLVADGDRLKKVAKRLGVTGFPAIFIYRPTDRQAPVRYSGPRTRDGLVRRIKKLLRPETEAIDQASEMDAFMARLASAHKLPPQR